MCEQVRPLKPISLLSMTSPPRMRTHRSFLILVFVVAGAWAGAATGTQAQEFGRLEEMKDRTNVAYFYHARPGEATVQVSVWGTVERPGIYEVGDTTSVDELLTMAGGAPIQPRQSNEDPARITVRLYRPQKGKKGERSLLFEAQIDSVLAGEATPPQIKDKDVLTVETVQPVTFTWRDALSLSSVTLNLAVLVVRILRLRN